MNKRLCLWVRKSILAMVLNQLGKKLSLQSYWYYLWLWGSLVLSSSLWAEINVAMKVNESIKILVPASIKQRMIHLNDVKNHFYQCTWQTSHPKVLLTKLHGVHQPAFMHVHANAQKVDIDLRTSSEPLDLVLEVRNEDSQNQWLMLVCHTASLSDTKKNEHSTFHKPIKPVTLTKPSMASLSLGGVTVDTFIEMGRNNMKMFN